MKTKKYLYSLAASALFLSGAYAADTELVLDDSQDGLTWADALWSNGVPTAEKTVLIDIADNTYPLIIDSIAESGTLTVKNNSYLLLTGEGNSLTLSESSNLELQNNSKMVVSNGAVLSIPKYGNSQYSLIVNNNSSFEVDGATFTGQFYNKVNEAVFKNKATWNMAGMGNMWDVNIQVVDSTINQTVGVGFGNGQNSGHSKVFTLQNSTWDTNGNGVSLAGIVNLYDSSITEGGHINIGQEGGNASYENTVTLRGSSATSLSTLSTVNLWWNTNGGNTSTTLHQAGNSNVSFSKFDSSNNTNGGGNVLWLFSGDNNTTTLTQSQDSSWGDNNLNKNTTGIWKITNAQTVGGVETFSTNSTFNGHSIYMRVSGVAGNNFQSIIDWAGTGNTFKTLFDVFPCLSTGADTSAVSSFTVRDGALADIGAYVVVGGKVDASLSGTASFNVLNGATFNQKYHVVLQNSTAANSTGQSEFNIINATWNRTGGNLYIGVGSNSRNDNPNQNAISGTSIATIKDAGTVTFGGGILLAGSSVDLRESESSQSNLAKLVIENTDFTMNGELWFGHQQSYGSTIYGGTTIIEINGENSALRSVNKAFYSGHSNTVYGGTREINVNGKNNTLLFAPENNSFYMNASGSGTQYGGDLSVNFNGEGHTFSVRDFQIGRTNAMGGSNTVYSKGTNAANKNQILLSESNVSIRGGAEGSTIVNTFHLAGNTILKRSNGETVNVGLATSATAGGTAAFRITGENNELYAYNFNMNSANSTGAKAIFEIEGSTHIISIINQFGFYAPSSNHALSTLSFVADANGISTINANSVQAFAGVLNIDFSKYAAQTYDEMSFTLISANNSWSSQNYETLENNDYVNVIKTNEDDTWQIVKEGNNLMLYYTSSAVIPEPSTFAAIFGAIALAFAAYRRKKQ